MKTLHRYIASSFLTALVMTLLLLVFVMSVGLLFKATELVAKGLPIRVVGNFIMAGLPVTLSFSIPIGALVSSLLVFGRLSADSEISAMKACGVSMQRIVSVPLTISGLLMVICLHLNVNVIPEYHYRLRLMKSRITVSTGLDLLEEGKWIDDFAGMKVYIGRREGDDLYDILMIDRTKTGARREIRAERANVSAQDGNIVLELHEVRVDPFQEDQPGAAHATRLVRVIPNTARGKLYTRRRADMDLGELMGTIRAGELSLPCYEGEALARLRRSLSEDRVEFHWRLALSVSCLCFVAMGVPLGIKTHRRESSIGIAVSLVVAFCFYVFMLLADSLGGQPELFPHLIVWIPVLLSIVMASFLISRVN